MPKRNEIEEEPEEFDLRSFFVKKLIVKEVQSFIFK